MRTRVIPLLVVLALVLAACNSGGSESTSTTTTAGPTTTSGPVTTSTTAPQAMQLSYNLVPGTSYTYEVDLNQQIELTTSGDPSALGEQDMPGEAQVEIKGTTVFTQEISEGPSPGTFEVHITADFSDLTATGTVDGVPIEDADAPDFAQVEPVDMVVVVDEHGNVVPDDGSGAGEDPFGMLGSLGALDQMTPGANLGQFIGPQLPDGDVAVGDTWSDTVETPDMGGSEPITTQIEGEIVETDNVDGHDVFVVHTTTTTSPIEIDLGDLIFGFMFAFVPDDATDEERAQMEAMADQIKFAFSIDEATSDMNSWFDYEAGLVRKADLETTSRIVVDVNMPDETTNEMVAYGMDMSLHQTMAYRLTEGAGA